MKQPSRFFPFSRLLSDKVKWEWIDTTGSKLSDIGDVPPYEAGKFLGFDENGKPAMLDAPGKFLYHDTYSYVLGQETVTVSAGDSIIITHKPDVDNVRKVVLDEVAFGSAWSSTIDAALVQTLTNVVNNSGVLELSSTETSGTALLGYVDVGSLQSLAFQSVVENVPTGCAVKYMFTNDGGSTWFYWDTTALAWKQVSSPEAAIPTLGNTSADLASADFTKLLFPFAKLGVMVYLERPDTTTASPTFTSMSFSGETKNIYTPVIPTYFAWKSLSQTQTEVVFNKGGTYRVTVGAPKVKMVVPFSIDDGATKMLTLPMQIEGNETMDIYGKIPDPQPTTSQWAFSFANIGDYIFSSQRITITTNGLLSLTDLGGFYTDKEEYCVTNNAVDLSFAQTLDSITALYSRPAGTQIYFLLSFDGGTTFYKYDTATSSWVQTDIFSTPPDQWNVIDDLSALTQTILTDAITTYGRSLVIAIGLWNESERNGYVRLGYATDFTLVSGDPIVFQPNTWGALKLLATIPVSGTGPTTITSNPDRFEVFLDFSNIKTTYGQVGMLGRIKGTETLCQISGAMGEFQDPANINLTIKLDHALSFTHDPTKWTDDYVGVNIPKDGISIDTAGGISDTLEVFEIPQFFYPQDTFPYYGDSLYMNNYGFDLQYWVNMELSVDNVLYLPSGTAYGLFKSSALLSGLEGAGFRAVWVAGNGGVIQSIDTNNYYVGVYNNYGTVHRYNEYFYGAHTFVNDTLVAYIIYNKPDEVEWHKILFTGTNRISTAGYGNTTAIYSLYTGIKSYNYENLTGNYIASSDLVDLVFQRAYAYATYYYPHLYSFLFYIDPSRYGIDITFDTTNANLSPAQYTPPVADLNIDLTPFADNLTTFNFKFKATYYGGDIKVAFSNDGGTTFYVYDSTTQTWNQITDVATEGMSASTVEALDGQIIASFSKTPVMRIALIPGVLFSEVGIDNIPSTTPQVDEVVVQYTDSAVWRLMTDQFEVTIQPGEQKLEIKNNSGLYLDAVLVVQK